jgi:hypothetical protein
VSQVAAADGRPTELGGRELRSRLEALLRRYWIYLLLVALLLAGTKMRLDKVLDFHAGDMSVMLAVSYAILTWPPNDYYQDYMAMPWVYNHLPAFPIMLAPFYWLFENVLVMSAATAAKLLIGFADLVIAVLLFRQARGPFPRAWGLVLAGAWLLSPWVAGANDHPINVATAFALISLATIGAGWLPGVMLALGVATRSEVAFLALPVLLHVVSTRGLRRSVGFVAAFGATIAVVGLPFFLYDPAAMEFALRGQLQRDAADGMSAVLSFLTPLIDLRAEVFLQENPSVLALALNLLVAPLALRDPRVARVALIASIAYLLTLPLVHERYLVIAYGAGLFYAASYGNPVVAVALGLGVWLGGAVWGMGVLMAAFLVLVLSSLLSVAGVDFTRALGVLTRWRALGERGGFAALLAVAMALASLGHAVREGLVSPPLPPWALQNGRTADLLEAAKEGRLVVVTPAGQNPADYVSVSEFTLQGEAREVLYMHPTASASMRVLLPDNARLQFAMAVRPEAWDQPGDGVDFQVEVRRGSEAELLFSEYINPKGDPSHRRWNYASVDLSRFAGEEVDIVLRTLPHESPDADWAGWAFPRVVVR